jgi:hypothetical protein
MLTDAVVSIGLHSHTHSSHSLCLSATLPFPLSFKRCCDTAILINRNIDFSVFGSLISKVTPTSNFMLNINMLNVIILNVVMLSVIMLNVIMLNVIMLNVVILNVVMLSVIMLNVIMLNVIMLNVIVLNVIMLNLIMPNVVMLIAVVPHSLYGIDLFCLQIN